MGTRAGGQPVKGGHAGGRLAWVGRWVGRRVGFAARVRGLAARRPQRAREKVLGCAGRRLVAEAHQLHWIARVILLGLGDEVVGLGPLRDWYAWATHYWLRKGDRLLDLDRGGALRLRGDDLRRARAHRRRRGCLELVQLGLEGEELVIRHAEQRARPPVTDRAKVEHGTSSLFAGKHER